MRLFLLACCLFLLPVLVMAQPSPAPVSSYVRPGLVKTNEADFQSYFGISGSADLLTYSNYVATNFATSNQHLVLSNYVQTNFASSNQVLVLSNYFQTNAVLSNAWFTYTNTTVAYLVAGSGVTLTTNANGASVTVAASGGGGASALTTNVTVAYTGTTNLIIDFLAAPCYGTNSQGDYHVTLTQASSYLIFTNMPGSPTNWIGNIHIKQDGTGGRALFFKTNTVFFPSGLSPTVTVTANGVDVFTFVKSINLTNVNCTYAQDFR